MPTLTNNAAAEGPALAPTATAVPLNDHATGLVPFVVVVENALRPDTCRALLDEFAASGDWRSARVGRRAEVSRDIRNVDVIDISDPAVIRQNPKVREALEQDLLAASLKVLRHYQRQFPACKIVQGHPFELLRYEVGGFYRTHTDSFSKRPRTLSCSFALNDDFQGGDWSFFGGQHRLRLPRGAAVMFPSNFMFPHEILEVTAGTRYAIVTWME